jgi:hypothetical protein
MDGMTTIDGRLASVAAYHAKGQRTFVLVILLSCLVLQRFGYSAGVSARISAAAMIGAPLAFWYVWTGVLSFDRKRVGLMLGLVGIGLIALNMQKNMPLAMVTRTSLVSLIYWLGITAFATLRFARPMSERVFFNILIRCLAFIAVCGIGAFLAQFVGIKMFSFRPIIPDQFLMESLYNVVIPLHGSIFKANGFFLVEPSTFSQFMALGLICEWLCERRTPYIVLFLTALFCSASGTGWLVIGSFVAYTGLTSGGRGVWYALVFSFLCLLAFVAMSFIFPAITDSLSGRIGEINMQGTSGYERFVAPILVLKQVMHVAPRAFFTGIGPGAVDTLAGITYVYTMNTPIKIIIEYGVFGLLLYLTLILWNQRTARQNAVLLPVMVLLLIAGGNDHFPPILFPVLLIATVANLTGEPSMVRKPKPADVRFIAPSQRRWVPSAESEA